MKIKLIRLGAFCTMLALLCAGAVFGYKTADQNRRANAVLVMAYHLR